MTTVKSLLLIGSGLLTLSACFNSEGGSSPAPKGMLGITKLEFAQTHVMPAGGLSWNLPGFKADEQRSLHLTGDRAALVLLEPSSDVASEGLKLEVIGANDAVLATVAMNAPDRLPNSEGGGSRYSNAMYSALLPAQWLEPGLRVRFATPKSQSAVQSVLVGASPRFTIYSLPFYLFGATTALLPLEQAKAPDQATQDEYFAKVPVSSVRLVNHPAGSWSSANLVIAPRSVNGVANAAYVASTPSDYDKNGKDGYAGMDAVLRILGAIRNAGGDSSTANQYYGALIQRGLSGQRVDTGGGLGGGHLGSGDHLYSGIFFHEQGHAFGMPHAADGYASQQYPYVGGSLKGSSWGYDAIRNQLLSPLIPSTSSDCRGCQTRAGQVLDAQGRCVKQDPMQSGAGSQDPSYKFAMFSDFNAAVVQRYFEGQTKLVSGTRTYDGGRIETDSSFASGYKHWDTLEQRYVEVKPATLEKGLYGLNMGLPVNRDTPVVTIIGTLSKAGTKGVTQIYPPLRYTGNLMRLIDPSSASDRADVTLDSGTYPWYCKASGCDYTVRVTFQSGKVYQHLLQIGTRAWFSPNNDPNALDATKASSFATWGVNVPDEGAIDRLELLGTPQGYAGLSANPTVLATLKP